MRLAMSANVGDRVHPLTRSGIERIQAIRHFQSVEEIFLYIPDTGFHAPLFVWSSHVTSTWLEAVMCCKVQIPGMKERLFAEGMVQNGGLGIVDEHFKWNTADEFEGVLMSAQEVFGRLAKAELEVTKATVAKHHDKEGESPSG